MLAIEVDDTGFLIDVVAANVKDAPGTGVDAVKVVNINDDDDDDDAVSCPVITFHIKVKR